MSSGSESRSGSGLGGARRRLSEVHLPDGSRSVQSPWVWRGLLFLALIAGGLAIALLTTGSTVFGVLWVVIALGWFGISMWLWRKHHLASTR